MFPEDFESDVVKCKNYPVPSGKSDVKINLLFDQDINCKNVTYEIITRMGATAGLKRKRAVAIGDDEESELQVNRSANPEKEE